MSSHFMTRVQAKQQEHMQAPEEPPPNTSNGLGSSSAALHRIEQVIAKLKSPSPSKTIKSNSYSNSPILSERASSSPHPASSPAAPSSFSASPPAGPPLHTHSIPSTATTSPTQSATSSSPAVDNWKRQVIGQIASLELSCESLQLQNTQLIVANSDLTKRLMVAERQNRAFRTALEEHQKGGGQVLSAIADKVDQVLLLSPQKDVSAEKDSNIDPSVTLSKNSTMQLLEQDQKKEDKERVLVPLFNHTSSPKQYSSASKEEGTSTSTAGADRVAEVSQQCRALQTKLKHLRQVVSIAKMDNFLQGVSTHHGLEDLSLQMEKTENEYDEMKRLLHSLKPKPKVVYTNTKTPSKNQQGSPYSEDLSSPVFTPSPRNSNNNGSTSSSLSSVSFLIFSNFSKFSFHFFIFISHTNTTTVQHTQQKHAPTSTLVETSSILSSFLSSLSPLTFRGLFSFCCCAVVVAWWTSTYSCFKVRLFCSAASILF